MEFEAHLHALRRDAAGLFDAARVAPPGDRLESCPEWTPIDLVWHVGGVYDVFVSGVRDGLPDRAEYQSPPRPTSDGDVRSFAESRAAELIQVLSTTDPSMTIWSERPPEHRVNVAWVARRMAHETAVHRHDAARAAGHEYQIEPTLASDGIDEFVTEILQRLTERGMPAIGGTVHLHCTDVKGEWIIEPSDDGGYEVRREHVKGDAAIRGPASDLQLVMWRRLPLSVVDVIGDQAVAERLVAHPR